MSADSDRVDHPYRDDALYRELINLRPSRPPAADNGPSRLLMQQERERLLWELASAVEDEAAGAA